MTARFATGNAAAPRAEVAHQVAGVLIRRIDFHVHDGLEQRRPRLFHGLLERQRAGNLESDIRRIHVVIFAIVENGPEIRHGKSREVAARGGIANALLDRRNPVFGDRPAENIVDELDALAALDRLHLDAAHAELAVAARLFFVLAFGVSLAANRFAVGNLGRLQREIDIVALLKLGNDDLDVLLAGAGKQEFFRLRVARKTQRAVFFENFVNGHADLVFVRAALGLNGKSDGRLRQACRRVINRRGLVPECFARGRFLQLGDGTDVAGMQLAGFGELLSLHNLNMLKAF